MALRPSEMYVDPAACIECGICDEIAPGIRDSLEHVPVSSLTIEAMANCPTGAIKWAEGGTDEADRRAHHPAP